MNPQFACHNICGLSIDSNRQTQFIPKSSDPKCISLKSILRDIDIVSFVETKLKSGNFNFERFFPLGPKLRPIHYTCTGQSDGILIYANSNSIEILNSETLFVGRLVKTMFKFKKSGLSYTFFTVYLPASDSALQSTIITKLNDIINELTSINPNINFVIYGDFNLPDIRNPIYNMTLNNPTKKLINLIDKYKLVDVAKKFGLLDPTWYGRGSRSHLNSVVDYAFCSNNVIVQEAKYFVTARSDHVVLCFSNKKTKKNIGAVPNERLFLSNDFSKHATAKLHECHENFTLAYPSILHDHDSDYFINWLETLSTCLDHVNMEYHAANFVSIVNKERCFRYKFLKTLKKLSNSSDKEELDKIKEEHLNDIEQQIDLVKKRFRIKAAQSYGRRSTSFAFANFKSKSDRKINSIQSLDNPGTDIFDHLKIVEEFSKYHQIKISSPDFTNDLKNASIPLDTKNDPISYIFKKFNLSFDNFFHHFRLKIST